MLNKELLLKTLNSFTAGWDVEVANRTGWGWGAIKKAQITTIGTAPDLKMFVTRDSWTQIEPVTPIFRIMVEENKYRIKSFQQLCKELIQSQPASIKSFKKHWAEHGKKLPKFLYQDEELAKLYQQQNLKTTGLHQAKINNCGPYQATYEKYVCSTSI